MPSELNVNKISPASGTEVSLGDSGDTITITSGVTLAGDGSNLTGVAPTKTTIEALGIELPAANLTGTIHADRYTDTVYTHPTTAGNKHIPTAGATDQILTYSSSGTASWAAPASASGVFHGLYYTNPMNTPGAHSITGVGFQPDAVWVQQIANRANGGISWGMADGTDDGSCFTSYEGISASKYDDQSSHLWWIWQSASNHVQAKLTSFDADGFTFTITETGTFGTPAGTIQFMCFKA
jgi:hypothetical protein